MNDLHNAYMLSQQLQTSHRVSVPFDMYAVVLEAPAYCPVTDATLPAPARSVARLCGSHRVAEYYARKEIERQDALYDGEVRVTVFGPGPKKLFRAPGPVATFDEIPF